MRKDSAGSSETSYLMRTLRLRASSAALYCASPNSTGPAEATAHNKMLIDHRTPTSSRQIPVNHDPADDAHCEQRGSDAVLVQQNLAGAEQHSVDERASGNPIEAIRPAVVRLLDIGT